MDLGSPTTPFPISGHSNFAPPASLPESGEFYFIGGGSRVRDATRQRDENVGRNAVIYRQSRVIR